MINREVLSDWLITATIVLLAYVIFDPSFTRRFSSAKPTTQQVAAQTAVNVESDE